MRLHFLSISFLLLAGTVTASGQQPEVAKTPIPNGQIIKNYNQVPLAFEENKGQTSGQVKFLSRGQGYTAFLTSGGMTLSLRPSPTESLSSSSAPASKSPNTILQFHLIGANPHPQVSGERPLPGRVNYFVGKDPSKWQTNLCTYGQVRYRNVYPGIDLIYYGNHQQLEYDFAVAPGVNPNAIQFEIQGASQTSIDGQGNLVLGATNSNLRFQSPVVYQESNGQRTPVMGSYVMKDASHVGFQLASYDQSKPLVIDPVLAYSTYLGGSGTDQATGLAVDSTGSVYITGYTDSADFPLAAPASLPTSANHAFVAKLDPTGLNLLYADYIGGSGDDYGVALVLDSSLNVYITGSTTSSDFPVVKAFQAQQPGPYSGFVSKLSSDGRSLLYSSYLGGSTLDVPLSIAIDNLNELHIAGYTMSSNFPVANAFQSAVSANQGGLYGDYGFLTKFSADGSTLLYSTYFAGNFVVVQNCGAPCYPAPYNAINSLTVDARDNAYITGSTNTTNFPTTSGAYLSTNPTQLGASLGFVSKFGSNGSLEYSTYLYGSSGDPVATSAIAVDAAGFAYVTGEAVSDGTFPVTNTNICDPGVWGFGCSYAFVSKFDPAGATLVYSTFLGPNNYAVPQNIAVDANGDAYVLSSTYSAAFQLNNGVESYTGQSDLLLVEIDPAANSQLFSTYLGTAGNDSPGGLAIDSQGNIYIAGSTDGTDLPVTSGAPQSVLGGGTDAFIVKIEPGAGPLIAATPASLQFSALPVGSTSAEMTVLLRNMSSSPLSITAITTTGDFAEFNTCGNQVLAAGSCSVSVSFTPTASGVRNGSIVIQGNEAESPFSLPLNGIGEGGSSTNPAPIAVLMPTALTFSTVPVGRSGGSQALTLTNAGNAPLSINNFQVVGDFSQSNNCPASLTPGSACSITVVFSPSVEGTRLGSLAVADNAVGNPQIVSLTGTGSLAQLAAAPTSLSYPNTSVGQSSNSQSVTLTNIGNAFLSITNVQVTGDFSQTNNCALPLATNTSCSVNIVFKPTAGGARIGLLTITDTLQSGSQTVSLAGVGTQASLALTPETLSFSNVPLQQPSAAQQVTVSNTGNAPLTITAFQVTEDYQQTNNCPSTVAAGSSCSVNVVFTPSATGARPGSLTVVNSAGVTESVTLAGTGSDFSLTAASNTDSVKPGLTATYTIAASEVGGSFPNAVSLTCSGLPAGAICSFSPALLTPGAKSATSTLTITTAQTSAENYPAAPTRQRPLNLLWMQGVGAVGMVLANATKRSRKALVFVIVALLLLGMMFMTGCAGGTGIGAAQQPSNPTSYTVTATGTSGSLQHTLPLTLTIQ
jgi:hypothetical protein